jgi:hypothetical protein
VNFRIETLHAFVSVDPDDGDEGVIAMMRNGQWIPLVAADERRLEQYRRFAQEIAQMSGRSIRVLRFEVRVDLDLITPSGPAS